MTIIIRPAEPADRTRIVQCIISLQDAGRRLNPRLRPGRRMAAAYFAQLRRRCRRCQGAIFVADCGGQILGFAAVLAAVPFTELDEPPGTYALVTDLFVEPSSRRRGIGHGLVTQAERHARRQGAAELRIGVLAGNDPASNLYRVVGFRPWAHVLHKRLRGLTTA